MEPHNMKTVLEEIEAIVNNSNEKTNELQLEQQLLMGLMELQTIQLMLEAVLRQNQILEILVLLMDLSMKSQEVEHLVQLKMKILMRIQIFQEMKAHPVESKCN